MINGKRSILCVDDEDRDLELQRAAFEAAGFHVITAKDLAQVNRVLARHQFHAVVLDYRLVNADPIHVAVTVRKQHPRMPIVVLSGYLEHIPEYFKRAVDDCLDKSSSTEAWVASLKDHAGGYFDTANGA